MSSIGNGELSRRKLDDALEVKSLRRNISAYLNYPEAAEEDIGRYERCFGRLPIAHKELLSHLPTKYQKLRWCVSQNYNVILRMLKAFDPPLDMSVGLDVSEGQVIENAPRKQLSSTQSGSNGSGENGKASKHETINKASALPDWWNPSMQFQVPLSEVDQVRSIIRTIVRDWSAEGQRERDECYKPILEELDRLFPHRSKDSSPTCLIPGAGLGRLAFEISRLGFISQGNEFSHYMMICSNFILNHCQTAEEWTIYPWIHSNCNSLSDDDQLLPVSFPDIHPKSAGMTEGFSICRGDFTVIYKDPSHVGAWDAVVTCFFLDTAHNVVEYIEILSKILKDGGVWINFGPLLYHFSDMRNPEDEMSIELNLEEVKRVAFHYGFELEKETTVVTTFAINRRSMMQNHYYPVFWTMRKKGAKPVTAA